MELPEYMKNLELSIEREIDFMIKYQLTADELFLIKLIFYAQDGHDEYISMFFSQDQLGKSIREILISLQTKGIINQTFTIPESGQVFNPQDVDFNKKVIKSLYQHSQDLGMDLFNIYPPYTYINGSPYSLRNFTKLYKSFDEMCFAYGKEIKFDLKKHEQIMNILEWAKDNNKIRNNLGQFIAERQWEMFEKMQNNDEDVFNTNELI